ncbi:MAG: phage portal protein family protein [Mycobacterium sp.]
MTTAAQTKVNGVEAIHGAEYGEAPLEQWNRKQIVGYRFEYLAATITRAERGDMEDAQDVFSFIKRSDAQIRSTYETLLSEVASLPREFVSPTEDPADIDFAAWCSEAWDQIPDRDSAMESALDAVGVSMAIGEQSFQRRAGMWYPGGYHFAPPRDVRFASDWTPVVRTYTQSTSGDWLDTAREPHRWFVHSAKVPGLEPHLSGLFFPVSWYWMFKKWVNIWGLKALERNGAGFWVGTVPKGARKPVRTAMRQTLEKLSAGHVAVKEDGSTIELIESDLHPGESHREQAMYFDDQITKLFLGSTLIVDSGTRGARSLGEEQSERTVVPRWRKMARRINESVVRQTFGPLALWNAHRFGGKPPRLPIMRTPTQDDKPMIDEWHVRANVASVDEVRRSINLETYDDERGQAIASIEDEPPDPKAQTRAAHQLSLPGFRPRSRTSATSEGSQSQAERVPLP